MADDASEQQITFNVKSSSDAKHVVTAPASTTIADLKQKLSTAEYANIPPDRQRLIYSGRVLKDADTIAGCKIKDGNTLHLVKGAESNSRQNGNPASQSQSGAAASNVPQNIAAGTGASNPLAQLTGARYAGFHGLPGMDSFGADGGMGAPPNSEQMLRMLDDPNFAQQMNDAMNNPAVIDMLRNNPMVRDNPMARAALENPELRRMMMDPDMIRMQMRMQRAMGGSGGDGQGSFPMPGQTDTTPAPGTDGANPFSALFGGANPTTATGSEGQQPQANPFASLLGQPSGQQDAGQGQQNPFQTAAQQLMQNPQMMQQMMQMMGGAAGGSDSPAAPAFNPWEEMGGGAGGGFGGSPEPQAPLDSRPPEERYADQLRQLNDMGFYEFERNVTALRRSGGSLQGAVEYLLSS